MLHHMKYGSALRAQCMALRKIFVIGSRYDQKSARSQNSVQLREHRPQLVWKYVLDGFDAEHNIVRVCAEMRGDAVDLGRSMKERISG